MTFNATLQLLDDDNTLLIFHVNRMCRVYGYT